jgi:hypothetical protein
MQEKLARRYADVFRLFLKHDVGRVTFWGVTDAHSWLDDFPIRGRTNYPLLWGRDGREKPAFGAVVDVLRSRARSHPIVIQFTFDTRQPIAQVKVNGAAPVPFVIDTGASVNVVEGSLLEPASRFGSPGTVGSMDARDTVEQVSLEVAGERWTGTVTRARLGYPASKHFAGLIGAPILSRYVVQLDFESGVVRLFSPGSFQRPADVHAIPFKLQEGLPIIKLAVDFGSGPIAARLMVDTGASQFIDFNRPFVDRHELLAALTDAKSAVRPAAVAGAAQFLYGTIDRVDFGGRAFERPRIGLSRATSGSSSRDDRDGIIGNDLLRHFRVTFDYDRNEMLLEARAR